MRVHTAALILTAAWLVSWPSASAVAQRGTPPAVPAAGGRRGGPQPPVGSMPAHRFEKIADGVYYSTSTGSMSVGANACVIVNDQDVFVLDPGESPAAARALVGDLQTITDRPIKFVASSHFHFGRSHG